MSAGRNKLIFFLAVAFVAGFAMTEKANSVQLESLPLEEAAYYRVIGGANPAGKNWKAEYIKKLSPGGKAYFLACRRDYKEALLALEKVPKRDTGSYFYVKAFCLEGLGRHAEALKFFDTAKAKINDDFNPGFRFYL